MSRPSAGWIEDQELKISPRRFALVRRAGKLEEVAHHAAALVLPLILAGRACGDKEIHSCDSALGLDTEESTNAIDERIAERRFRSPNATIYDPLLERIADAHYVPSAKHRMARRVLHLATKISQRLILEKGFSFIAVEGDCPDCYRRKSLHPRQLPIVRERPRRAATISSAWPTWMWAKPAVVELVRWLRPHNNGKPEEASSAFIRPRCLEPVGFALIRYCLSCTGARPNLLPGARPGLRVLEPCARTSRLCPSHAVARCFVRGRGRDAAGQNPRRGGTRASQG